MVTKSMIFKGMVVVGMGGEDNWLNITQGHDVLMVEQLVQTHCLCERLMKYAARVS